VNSAKENFFMTPVKLAIIGSGPAGYTAAIYAARAQLNPVVFAGYQSGGQLMSTTEVENFPGFKEGVMGPQLMITMREQATRFGTEIRDELVTAVDFSERPFKIWTTIPEDVMPDVVMKGSAEEQAEVRKKIMTQEPTLLAESVIISTGAGSITLGVPGEHEFWGRGVSTCAVCDAAFYRDKDTYVIGGGDSAMEDTLALTKFAKSVTVIHRRDSFRASKIMQDRVLNHPKVKVLWNSQVKEIKGAGAVTTIVVTQDGKEKELPAEGVFVAIGHKPVTSLFVGQIELDEHGYIVTRQSLSKHGLALAKKFIDDRGLMKFPTTTSVEGVFAAGDVVDVRYKQAITAAGQGCQAALDAERWLESR
jgi:thioredoxin reductase (NADPH)